MVFLLHKFNSVKTCLHVRFFNFIMICKKKYSIKKIIGQLKKIGGGDMGKKVSYRINFDKAVEVILWISQNQPNIDIYHIGKTIFYAEKYHINRYARPIIGDEYCCGDFGPFPSAVRDIIQKKEAWLDWERLASVSDSFSVKHTPYATPIPKRNPNMDLLSGTDIECLQEALKLVGKMSFGELKNFSHEESCYLNAGPNESIDYLSLIDNDNPLRNEIIKEIEETYKYAVI